MAALIFQVTWVRLLGLSMGSTSASVGTVLAAFFLGMALGSYFSRYFINKRISTLWVYVILECLIGLSGLALLPILLHLDVHIASFPVLGKLLLFKFFVSVSLLSIPSICIGATFPVMANFLILQQHDMGRHLGTLYSFNTFGAVLGALFSGFLIIPSIGLDGAIYFAAALNFIIVILCFILLQKTKTENYFPAQKVEINRSKAATCQSFNQSLPLTILFFTGLMSIASEVGYTKFVSIFIGTTIYGFSAILSIFLIGISFGSWFIKSRIDRIRNSNTWVSYSLLLLGISFILTKSGLNVLPAINDIINNSSVPVVFKLLIRYTAILCVLLPPTFLFGVLFPLNLKSYCRNLPGLHGEVGKGYAVNTIGGVIGSLLAGFYIIPRFGTDILLSLLGGLALFSSLFIIPYLKTSAHSFFISVMTIFSLIGLFFFPKLNYQNIIASNTSNRDNQLSKKDFLFLKEGKSSVVSLTSFPGNNIALRNNEMFQSIISKNNPNIGSPVMSLLAAIPYLYHENPKTAFQVGFGGGLTTYALTTTELESIHVVEIEPAIIEAVQSLHKGAIPALSDPRVRLSINDARHILLMEDKTYDLIISQPSHPWAAGAANLFSTEFYELVSSKLNSGGIFLQWLNFYRSSHTTLRPILKSFYGIFPHGIVFGSNLDLFNKKGILYLIGATHPIKFDPEQVRKRLSYSRIYKGMIPNLIRKPADLLQYYLLSRKEALKLAGESPPNTDTNILSEVSFPVQDSFQQIPKHAHFDITDHVGSNPEKYLYFNIGQKFFQSNQFRLMEQVEKKLFEIGSIKARWLKHQRLIREHYYPAAETLYRKYTDWPDSVHSMQATAFIDLKRYHEAEKVIKKIGEKTLGRVDKAIMLFEQKKWRELADIKPRSLLEKSWQLIGLAHEDLMFAGQELSKMADKKQNFLSIPQLFTLKRYLDENPKIPLSSTDIDKIIYQKVDSKIRLLEQLMSDAIEKGEKKRALLLLHKIRKYLKQDSNLVIKLRKKILQMGRQSIQYNKQ